MFLRQLPHQCNRRIDARQFVQPSQRNTNCEHVSILIGICRCWHCMLHFRGIIILLQQRGRQTSSSTPAGPGRSRQGYDNNSKNDGGNKNAELVKLMLNDPAIIDHVPAHVPTFESVCAVLEHDPNPRRRADHLCFLLPAQAHAVPHRREDVR